MPARCFLYLREQTTLLLYLKVSNSAPWLVAPRPEQQWFLRFCALARVVQTPSP
jgi:hypothetical protein